jgi:hypothetical protein
MLSDKAIRYYRNGYSCSQCIIMASCDTYSINADRSKLCSAVRGISNGFGVGAMCSVPITCAIIIGMLYTNEADVKSKRLEFMLRFNKALCSFNCSSIQHSVKSCEQVIALGCDILSELLAGNTP